MLTKAHGQLPFRQRGFFQWVRFACLLAVILTGFVLGQTLSPWDPLSSAVRVDEQYLATIRNQTVFIGFGVSLAASVANLLLRIAHLKVLLAVTFVAAVWFAGVQSADPGSLSYLASALADHLILTVLGAAPVVGLFWLVERRVRGGPS